MKGVQLACVLIMALLATTPALAKSKQEIPANWKTECVGYFQISVPGNVEIATVPWYSMREAGSARANFSNAKWSVLSSLSYVKKIQVSNVGNEQDFINYRNKIVAEVDLGVRKYEANKSGGKRISSTETANDVLLNADGSTNRVSSTAIYRNGRFYQFDDGTLLAGEPDSAERRHEYLSFIEKFRHRALFEIPNESGVCIPYGFIKDDGRQPREVGTGMRLTDHPDITITLTDQAPPRTWNRYVKNPTVSEELKYTWGGRQWDNIKGVRIIGFPKYPSVTIAGYKGRSSFVEMVRLNDREKNLLIDYADKCTWAGREDDMSPAAIAKCPPETNIVDYGYMAYVKGDKDAKEDTPTLVLNVMQNAADGPDGKPTMTKEEFREMAETIAASIRRRHLFKIL